MSEVRIAETLIAIFMPGFCLIVLEDALTKRQTDHWQHYFDNAIHKSVPKNAVYSL